MEGVVSLRRAFPFDITQGLEYFYSMLLHLLCLSFLISPFSFCFMAILSNRYAHNTDFSVYQTLGIQINNLIVHSLKEVSSLTLKLPHTLEFAPEKKGTTISKSTN
jgi:hypothetical protein